MFGRTADPFLPTDHMADFHVVIIHYIGEMVGGKTIGFANHLVVDLSPVNGYLSAKLIGEGAFSGFGIFIRTTKGSFSAL